MFVFLCVSIGLEKTVSLVSFHTRGSVQQALKPGYYGKYARLVSKTESVTSNKGVPTFAKIREASGPSGPPGTARLLVPYGLPPMGCLVWAASYGWSPMGSPLLAVPFICQGI